MLPGVGIAARPGPPAPGGMEIKISDKNHAKKIIIKLAQPAQAFLRMHTKATKQQESLNKSTSKAFQKEPIHLDSGLLYRV